MSRRIVCGINIDPMNSTGKPSAQELQELGATWVRFTFKDTSTDPHPAAFATYDDTVHELAQAGINILMILNYETYPGPPTYDDSMDVWQAYIAQLADRCARIARHYGDRVQAQQSWVQAYQIWNEPDLTDPRPTYDPRLREEVMGRMLRATFEAVKENSTATLVVGGLASGDPAYLARVAAATGGVLYADAVGVHPYGQRPTPDWPTPTWGFGVLGDLISHYARVTRKPIWITEYGTDSANEDVWGAFPGRAYEAVNELYEQVPGLFWFCWSDGMVRPYGLVEADGTVKASYYSYQGFACLPAVEEPPVEPPVVDHYSHFVLFAPGVGWNWYHASRHYLQKYRVTRGESLEDATRVHGTLGHTVTCINPTPAAIQRLRQLNPQVHLDIIYADNVAELEAEMDRRADNDLRFG
jgi:hypothetical protein